MKPIFFLLVTALVLLFSCEKEKFVSDKNAGLEFSADTIYFDTVFTTLSTVTRRFTVKNNYGDFLRISSVKLAGGENSVFRVNVDGVPGIAFHEIEIAPHDSLYVFVNATLDANNSNNVLLYHDSLVFTVNQNTQDVDLMAWGQDVHILRDSLFTTQTWTNEKPYLILDAAGIDSLNTLTIQEGTKIYFHRNAAFYVFGTLKVEGTKDNPVIFRGDRLEKEYDDVPGQWQNIIFAPGSKENYINYAEISCAISGAVLQTSFGLADPVDLVISNTKISHMSAYGLRAADAIITGHNLVVFDCGISALAFELGGSYEFAHSTIANKPLYASGRETPSVYMNNFLKYLDANGQEKVLINDLEKATFRNCVVYGSLRNELGVYSNGDQGMLNYLFDHCITKFDPAIHDLSDTQHFRSVWNNTDPGFISWDNGDFRPDSASAMTDKGDPDTGSDFPLDFEGKNRLEDGKPDLGAYEYLE